MLHPILIIPFGEILPSMSSTRFLSRCRGNGRLLSSASVNARRYSCVGEKILKFESFYEIGIPYHTAIFDTNVFETFIDFGDFLDSFLQGFFSTENRDVTIVNAIACGEYVCMVFCMSRRILAVGSGPLACLNLSRFAMEAAPRSAETGLCGLPMSTPPQGNVPFSRVCLIW